MKAKINAPFNVLLDSGETHSFRKGECEVPEEVLSHWYFKVHAECGAVEIIGETEVDEVEETTEDTTEEKAIAPKKRGRKAK